MRQKVKVPSINVEMFPTTLIILEKCTLDLQRNSKWHFFLNTPLNANPGATAGYLRVKTRQMWMRSQLIIPPLVQASTCALRRMSGVRRRRTPCSCAQPSWTTSRSSRRSRRLWRRGNHSSCPARLLTAGLNQTSTGWSRWVQPWNKHHRRHLI